jgi:hypothetical protein
MEMGWCKSALRLEVIYNETRLQSIPQSLRKPKIVILMHSGKIDD